MGDALLDRVRSRVVHWAAPLLAGTLAAILGVAFLRHSDYHNPFDEYTHYDYVVKIAMDLRVPPMNDTLGQVALQEWACSGEPSFQGLTCGASRQDPALAPWGGMSPATTFYSPVLYLATGALTRTIHTIAPGVSWMDSARIASLLWLMGLGMLTAAVGRQLGGPTTAALAASIVLVTMPQVLVQGVTVGNDVPAMFMAMLTVWVWLAMRPSRAWRRVAFTGVGATAALLTKQHAVVALVIVGLLESARGYQVLRNGSGDQESGGDPSVPGLDGAAARPGEPTQEGLVRPRTARGASTARSRAWVHALTPATALFVAPLAAFVAISYLVEPLLRGARKSVPGMEDVLRSAEPQQLDAAAIKAYGWIGSVFQSPAWVPGLNSPGLQLLPELIGMLVLGGLFYGTLRTKRPWCERPEGIVRQSTAIYVALFPLMFLVYLRISGQALFSQPRYNLVGAAFAVTVFFVGARRHWAWLSLMMAVLAWGYVLRALLELPLA